MTSSPAQESSKSEESSMIVSSQGPLGFSLFFDADVGPAIATFPLEVQAFTEEESRTAP